MHRGTFASSSIAGARGTVSSSEGDPIALGFARIEQPFEIATNPFSMFMTPSLHLYLHPGQLGALESFRGTGYLSFKFLTSGTGAEQSGHEHVQGDWRLRIPCSDWIEKLRSGRIATDDLGLRRFGHENWSTGSLKRLAADQQGMSKEERDAALFAALRHYTHQAHHGPGDGGVSTYTRAESQFVLSVTAAAASYAQAGQIRFSVSHGRGVKNKAGPVGTGELKPQ